MLAGSLTGSLACLEERALACAGAPAYAHTVDGSADSPLKSICNAGFQPVGVGRKSPDGGGVTLALT